jgi:hypothetical protein
MLHATRRVAPEVPRCRLRLYSCGGGGEMKHVRGFAVHTSHVVEVEFRPLPVLTRDAVLAPASPQEKSPRHSQSQVWPDDTTRSTMIT